MTSPIVSEAFSLFDSTVTNSVNTARAAVELAPTGGVQSGIDFDALGSADLYFLQVGGDVGQVFAQDFEAVIMEALTAGILASSIVTNIESGIAIGAPKPLAATAATAATADTTDTVSSVLAQVQQAATAALASANTVFQNAKDPTKAPISDNLPSGNELQVLGGQILFQQAINTFLSSLPTSLSTENESNGVLIGILQNLLLVEQNASTILSEIDTNNTYEQPIALTGLNVALVATDAAILTDVSVAAVMYALWALEGLTGELVTVSAVGAYSVPIPSGTTYVDIVLNGAGAGGGGYNNAGSGTGGDGGATTATPTGGSTLTAPGGGGGASSTSAAASAGGSPGNESFDGQTYTGGVGGAVGYNSAGGNGTAPGGGGGGGGAYGSFGGQGGGAGSWVAQTIAVTSGMTEITGTVGAGGTAGTSSATEPGGAGANGSAFFYFYT